MVDEYRAIRSDELAWIMRLADQYALDEEPLDAECVSLNLQSAVALPSECGGCAKKQPPEYLTPGGFLRCASCAARDALNRIPPEERR